MKKILISLLTIIMCFVLVGCDKKVDDEILNNNVKQNNENKQDNKQEEYSNNDYVNDDDEIIDPNDYEEIVGNNDTETFSSTLINCNDCVFAIYTNNKTFGDILTDYTKDYNTLKDRNGKQRRRFMGHVIDSNGKILKSFACGIKDGKAFCLQGATDSSTYQYNIGILNQVFKSGECRYISNGNTYTCTDGKLNGDTRVDGYVSVHYDDSCYVFGETSMFGCYSK